MYVLSVMKVTQGAAEPRTADRKADRCTASYRQQDSSSWVFEQEARQRERGYVGGHVCRRG